MPDNMAPEQITDALELASLPILAGFTVEAQKKIASALLSEHARAERFSEIYVEICSALIHAGVPSFGTALEAIEILSKRAEAMQRERDQGNAAAELRQHWPAFCDADPVPDGFVERMERAGLAMLRKVKRAALETAFAAERGIEKGGTILVLTLIGERAMCDPKILSGMPSPQPSPETEAAKDKRIAVLEKALRIIKAENDRAKREFTNVSNKVIELAIAATLADAGKSQS